MQLKFDWLIVLENLRMKERLFVNPNDETAPSFLAALQDWQSPRQGL